MRWVAGALLALAACTVPYQPLQSRVEKMPDGAFDLMVEVVRGSYGRLELADASELKIQSAWVHHDRQGVAGKKRATVFVDDGDRMNVVVETRYLRIDFFGDPEWSPIVGDPKLERELMNALVGVLEEL